MFMECGLTLHVAGRIFLISHVIQAAQQQRQHAPYRRQERVHDAPRRLDRCPMMLGPPRLSLASREIAGGMLRGALRDDGSRFCRDEVQPVCGGQIKRIADQRRTRIERRIHLDLGQQFLSPSCTKNGHATLVVADVEPVAGH